MALAPKQLKAKRKEAQQFLESIIEYLDDLPSSVYDEDFYLDAFIRVWRNMRPLAPKGNPYQMFEVEAVPRDSLHLAAALILEFEGGVSGGHPALLATLKKNYIPNQKCIPCWKGLSPFQQAALLSFVRDLSKGKFYQEEGFEVISAQLKHREFSFIPSTLMLYRSPGTKEELQRARRRRAEGLMWSGETNAACAKAQAEGEIAIVEDISEYL